MLVRDNEGEVAGTRQGRLVRLACYLAEARCMIRLAHHDCEARRGWAGHRELCRQHGSTEQTYYRWKAKYGGMDSGEAKKLKQLEDENWKLEHAVADLTLDNRALKDVLSHLACRSSVSSGRDTGIFAADTVVQYRLRCDDVVKKTRESHPQSS
jgi:hypothetical protein